ncbi:MAG TPA: hypothetical protein VFO58_23475, partial [Vicinamibacterales bacterium]|nr:hypothetical protein [Vicinamibacterales bacterium]
MSSSTRVALCALTLAIAFQNSGQAADDLLPADALPFSLSYTVTGDYAVATVDLLPEPDNQDGDPGYQTGTINVGTSSTRLVPQNAEILAAFLYWETLAHDAESLDAQFRGLPISLVRVNQQQLTGTFAPCWSESGNTLFMMRADVLMLLPLQLDENGFPTGRRLVNNMDLTAAGLPLNTVRLPERGTGNQTPQTAGASLFLVYRDPSAPLKRIVVYDGLHVMQQGETGVQRIRGFLQSSGAPARLTQIVARGQVDDSDQLTVSGSGTTSAGNLFFGNLSPGSDRAWASPTTTITGSLPGAQVDYSNTVADEREFGEQLTMTYAYGNTTYNGCHTFAAIAASIPVQDADADGLIDRLEQGPPPGVSVLRDPNGAEYPKLWTMGAGDDQKDLFVEINSMVAAGPTSYGSALHRFPLTSQDPDADGVVTDPLGHDHKPTPATLTRVGDALYRAGVRAHFDLGPLESGGTGYSVNGTFYPFPAATPGHPNPATYFIDTDASGGESILETACLATDPLCQFPAFPGTVSWKYHYQLIRDELLDSGTGLRRFDPIRNHIFHHLLFAHSRGIAKSVWPCLNGTTEAAFPVNDPSNPTAILTCAAGGLVDNPLFHVPMGVSGVSDLPGFSSMVTLGMSSNFLGTEFFQASTILHELGHSVELWHGGAPPVFSASAMPSAPPGSVHVEIQANCKPGYQSSMSYLHQLYGLIDASGVPNIDYSNTTLGVSGGVLDETTQLGNDNLVASGLTPRRYRIAWYSPIVPPTAGEPGNLAYLLGVPAATRHCDGTPKELTEPSVGRLQTDSIAPAAIDWAGDAAFSSPLPSDLDVNFDGAKNALQGINDLDHLRVNQLGGGQNAGGFSTGIAYLGQSLTVDGIPYLGGPQYIGGVPFPGGGVAFPGGGVAYPGGGSYIGGVAYPGGGVPFGGGGVAFGGAGVAYGGGGIPFGGAGFPIIDGFVVVNYQRMIGGVPFGGGGVAFGGAGIPFGGGGVPFPGGGVAFPGGGVAFPGGGIAFPGAGVPYPGGGVAFPGGGEIGHDDIIALGHAPLNQVTACVIGVSGCGTGIPLHRHLVQWVDNNLDGLLAIRTFKVIGATVTSTGVALPDVPASASSSTDSEEYPHGLAVTYWTKG